MPVQRISDKLAKSAEKRLKEIDSILNDIINTKGFYEKGEVWFTEKSRKQVLQTWRDVKKIVDKGL